MKKKSVILIIVLIFTIFIVYKFVMLKKYKVEIININGKLIFNETFNIKYNKTDNVKWFEKMAYCDCFIDFINKENTEFKVKYGENGEIVSFYNITKEKQYIFALNENSFMLISDNEKKGNNNYSTKKQMKKFLNDNQIYNDIDLIKYIKENYYLDISIFSTLMTMKKAYIINSFVQVTLPSFESITLINGEKIVGYMINIKTNLKEIHLLYNDDQYIITLSGNEITTPQFIKQILESIKFN